MHKPQLNRSLVLEGPVRIADGAGGFTARWEPLGVLWAEIRAGSGRDALAGQVPVAQLPLKITVRAAPQGAASRPLPGQRFVDGSRIFRIRAVAEQGAFAQLLVCHAEEEVSP